MLRTFLIILCYKDLKTVKTLKIRQNSAKIWCSKVCKIRHFVTKNRFFSNFESPYLRTALLYFQYFYSSEILIGQSRQKSYYHVLSSCLFFWRQSWHVISRQNVTNSKNKKHTIFRNVKFHPVRKFRDIPS